MWNIWPFWIRFCFIFISKIIKINNSIFRCSSSSVLLAFPTLIPYGYDLILSKSCNILSLLLSAILLTSSAYTLCASLSNLYCNAKFHCLASNSYNDKTLFSRRQWSIDFIISYIKLFFNIISNVFINIFSFNMNDKSIRIHVA